MDKEALFARRLGTQVVELDAGPVIVRALSRGEAMSLRGKEMPVEEMERRLLALAMVDPAMTEDDVRQWQEASPAGEIETVTNAVLKVSGMEVRADREAYRRFRKR